MKITLEGNSPLAEGSVYGVAFAICVAIPLDCTFQHLVKKSGKAVVLRAALQGSGVLASTAHSSSLYPALWSSTSNGLAYLRLFERRVTHSHEKLF